MLKVVAIVDKKNTALDRLAQGLKPYFTNLNYVVIDCHPKRPSPEQLEAIERECIDADLIDGQYFKTLEKLRSMYPWLKEKKTILSHHNPYSITESDWNGYDLVIGNNKYIYEKLQDITTSPVEYVPLAIDTDFWTYQPEFTPNNNVIMVANRIESKKGVLEVAEACKLLNLNLQLVGAISDGEYFQRVIDTGVVRFHEQISDEDLRNLYYKSTVHVCNSVDGFESGTLPILEAMLCGVPVITRKVGHVPELYNGENMLINEKDNTDVENIQNLIYELISDKKKLLDIRDKAWNTAKSRSNERRAYLMQKHYREVLFPDEITVSIIMPVCGNPEIVRKSINAISEQTYKNIELIIADDSLNIESKQIIDEIAPYVNFPIRYMNTGQYIGNVFQPKGYKSYGLARARNNAAIEATGELLIFIDQRNIMEPECVEEFVKFAKPRYWLFGDKGANKTSFVENLSCVYRQDFINGGMFCERMDAYGGLSQETRLRFRTQGINTEYVKSAKALASGKSSNRNQKRADILKMKTRLWKMNLEN